MALAAAPAFLGSTKSNAKRISSSFTLCSGCRPLKFAKAVCVFLVYDHTSILLPVERKVLSDVETLDSAMNANFISDRPREID